MRAMRLPLAGVLLGSALLALPGCGFFPHMGHQPSIKPYERAMPRMPANVIPVSGTEVLPGPAAARALVSPVQASPEARDAGRIYYGYYCTHCHGAAGDSRTPVGDSYVPVPARLDSPRVQGMTDGVLFRAMVVGRGHDPVMRSTVPPLRRWYIVQHVRTFRK